MRGAIVSIVLLYQFLGAEYSVDGYIVEPGPVVLATKGSIKVADNLMDF